MTTRQAGIKDNHVLIGSLLVVVILGILGILGTGWARASENWFEKGLVELKQGHYQRAVDAFSIAIETVPHDFEALNNRGFARIYTGDYDGAIADCTKAIRFNPGSAKAYNNRGFAYIFKESYAAALADFDRALAINPRYVDAYSNRCLVWIRREHYDQAVTDCSQALAINPRSAKSLYNRGFARDRQGDPAGALGDYVQALTVNPDYIEVYNNIAWILATSPDPRLRDGRRAVALAEKAAAHTPDVNFLDTLAAAYAEAGRYDEAVAMENRVISILAANGQAGELGPHVERLSLFEEGRPYRDPVPIQPVSAVTDLDRQLETLDRLMQPEALPAVAGPPRETPVPRAEDRQTPTAAAPPLPATQTAQAPSAATLKEVTVADQTVFTPAGDPVEIVLQADAPDRLPISFEIETVPFQGSLSGTVPHLVYTPRAGFTGTDRFTFRAANAVAQSRLATVVINVGGGPETESPQAGAPSAGTATPDNALPRMPASSETDPMPTPAVSLPAEPVPGTAAMKPAETPPATPAQPAPMKKAGSGASPPQPEANPPEGLSPDDKYAIQVRSFTAVEDAAQAVARLQDEGFVAFRHAVEIPGRGIWHRVYINAYPTMAEARQGLADLDAARFKGALIRRIPDALRPATAPPAAAERPAVSDAPSPPPAAAPPQVVATMAEKQRPSSPYAYRIKAYRKKDDAFQLGVELTSMGRRAFIGIGRLGTTGDWYRVYVGSFRTPEEAEDMREDLAKDGFEEAVLTTVPYAITIQPPEHDPHGETLENQLLASGFLPYRRPGNDDRDVLVGGFQSPDEAKTTLEALESAGYDAQVVKR